MGNYWFEKVKRWFGLDRRGIIRLHGTTRLHTRLHGTTLWPDLNRHDAEVREQQYQLESARDLWNATWARSEQRRKNYWLEELVREEKQRRLMEDAMVVYRLGAVGKTGIVYVDENDELSEKQIEEINTYMREKPNI